MKPVNLSVFCSILLAFIFLACNPADQERVINEKDMPKVVLYVFNKTYPTAIVFEYAEEIKDNHKYYEISFEFEGRKIDAVYQPDGTVYAIEEMVDPSQLPENIKKALENEIPGFKINTAEKVDENEKHFFEVKGLDKNQSQHWEIKLSPAGSVIKKEKIDPDE
ncbi:MAG: hypothetical protein DWQ05_21610 [Calditrichaeota bacterium]|nr:MAG: hypothetical protein DWQ05_21610 [Calditrichota bacterium]